MAEISNFYVDPVLTNLAVEYRNGQFIADQVMPIVPVLRETGLYWVFGKEAFKIPRTRRAPYGESARIDVSGTTTAYVCAEYAIRSEIEDRERDNSDDVFRLQMRKTRRATDAILLDREKRVAGVVQSTSTFANAGPSVQWSTIATADPVNDVRAAKKVIRNKIGREANTMIIPQDCYDSLVQCSKIIDRIKYTAPMGDITSDILQRLFGIPNILIAASKYNSAQDGDTTTLADVWTDTIVIAYVSQTPSIEDVSLGYTLRQRNFQVRTWRDDPRHCNVIEPSVIDAEEVVAADAGYLITDVMA